MQFRFYASCDSEETSRAALTALPIRSEHLFKELLHRIDATSLMQLQRLQKERRAAYHSEIGKHGQSTVCSKVLGQFTRSFLDAASKLLAKAAYPNAAWCEHHHKFCPIWPDHVESMIHLEVGGNTCTPWSAQNRKCESWLDPVALPCLVWLASTGKVCPHLFVNECVPSFDAMSILPMFLQNTEFSSVVFGPDDLGIPAKRDRRYTIGWRKDFWRPAIALDSKNFKTVAGRVVKVDGRIFMRASADQVREYNNRLAAARHLPAPEDGESYRCLDVMRSADRLRLERCVEGSARENLFWDVTQGHMRPRSQTRCIPTLLRNSLIFETSTSRLILPFEMLCAQCLPFSLPEGNEFAKFQPVSLDLLEALGDRTVRHLAGNGMTLPAVGSIILTGLALAVWNE